MVQRDGGRIKPYHGAQCKVGLPAGRRRACVPAQAMRHDGIAALFRALGGGWWNISGQADISVLIESDCRGWMAPSPPQLLAAMFGATVGFAMILDWIKRLPIAAFKFA